MQVQYEIQQKEERVCGCSLGTNPLRGTGKKKKKRKKKRKGEKERLLVS